MISEETKQFLEGANLEVLGRVMDNIFETIDATQKGYLEHLTFNSEGFDTRFVERYGDGDFKDQVEFEFKWADILNIDTFFEKRRALEAAERLEAIKAQARYSELAEERLKAEYERLHKKFGAK